MGESILPSGDEQIRKLMESVDREVASPTLRATVIHTLIKSQLPHATVWDITCFCIEYLGTIVTVEPWIKPVVRHISKLVYIAHYYHAKGLESCLEPSGVLKPVPTDSVLQYKDQASELGSTNSTE